jgi:hypothetical protein
MGVKMDYAVAMDRMPSKPDPDLHGMDGAMAKTWMAAAGKTTLPMSFIVQNRRIVWIGNPGLIDKPLKQVVDGTWDANAFAKRYAEDLAVVAAVAPYKQKLDKATEAGDSDGFNTAFKELFEGPGRDDTDDLNYYAWAAVEEGSNLRKRDLTLIRRAMEHVVDLEGRKNYGPLDTLARVYFVSGDRQKALSTEREALALAPQDAKKNLEASIRSYGG